MYACLSVCVIGFFLELCFKEVMVSSPHLQDLDLKGYESSDYERLRGFLRGQLNILGLKEEREGCD